MVKIQRTNYQCGCIRKFRNKNAFWVEWKLCRQHDTELQEFKSFKGLWKVGRWNDENKNPKLQEPMESGKIKED